MSLLASLRKKRDERFATATPATFATLEGEMGRTVASIATVAVAKSLQGHTAPPANVGAGDLAASRWWLIHYADRDAVEITCSPPATFAEVMAWRPDAIAAEPFERKLRRQATAVEAKELRRLYDALAERNLWPMPDTWYGDREAILSDPDAALVTLQNLIGEVGQ